MKTTVGIEQKLIDCIFGCSSCDLENLITSAQGSKLMQDVLKQYSSKNLVDIVFAILIKKDTLYRIMTNKYANYFVQLLFKKIVAAQKSEILELLVGNFEQIFVKTALHQIGTHCL